MNVNVEVRKAEREAVAWREYRDALLLDLFDLPEKKAEWKKRAAAFKHEHEYPDYWDPKCAVCGAPLRGNQDFTEEEMKEHVSF